MVLNFTKKESYVVFFTLGAIIFVTYLNLLTSFRRARDVQRQGDLRAIYNALVAFQVDTASFPASHDGKIVACLGGYNDDGIPQRRDCEWREDGLKDIFYEGEYPDYITTLPSDPHHDKGLRYVYLSNGRHFQLFTALEGGEDEAGYNPEVVARNIMCGTKVCDYGISDGETPLDISVEEYENILRMRKLEIQNSAY